jgi:ATP-binding cassette subfamily B protein
MLWLDWRVAVWMILLLPLLAALAVLFQSRLLKSSRLVRRTNSRITAFLSEGIAGVRTTKSLAREGAADAEFAVLTTEMEVHSMRNSFQSAVFVPVVTSASFLGVAIALWRGGLRVVRLRSGACLAIRRRDHARQPADTSRGLPLP